MGSAMSRIRPFDAAKHFVALLRDKENTGAVFELSYALNGRQMERHYRRFAVSEIGRKLIADPGYYLRAFSDQDRLSRLPEGTVGRGYAEFLRRENLQVDGVHEALLESGASPGTEHDNDPVYRAFSHASCLTHDLFHILTGYERDALGEVSILRFTTAQHGGRGSLVLAHLGAMRLKAEAPGLPVYRCLREAKEMAQRADDLLLQDLTEVLELSVGEARARFGIVPSPTYRSLDPSLLRGLWDGDKLDTGTSAESLSPAT
jgi:ubiquinone biosynthesis protein COQ4